MTTTGPVPPADLVELGRIAGAYGVRGWIRVRPHGRADESALRSASEAWIRLTPPRTVPPPRTVASGSIPPATAAGRPAPRPPDSVGEAWQRIELVEARPHADMLLLRMDGCSDREQAEQLKGAVIAASRSSFPEPAPDEYYWVDLVGCEVVGQEGRSLGRVLAIDDFGAPHPVLRVGGPDGETRLIPFVAPVIGDVDLVAKRISADWAADY